MKKNSFTVRKSLVFKIIQKSAEKLSRSAVMTVSLKCASYVHRETVVVLTMLLKLSPLIDEPALPVLA